MELADTARAKPPTQMTSNRSDRWTRLSERGVRGAARTTDTQGRGRRRGDMGRGRGDGRVGDAGTRTGDAGRDGDAETRGRGDAGTRGRGRGTRGRGHGGIFFSTARSIIPIIGRTPKSFHTLILRRLDLSNPKKVLVMTEFANKIKFYTPPQGLLRPHFPKTCCTSPRPEIHLRDGTRFRLPFDQKAWFCYEIEEICRGFSPKKIHPSFGLGQNRFFLSRDWGHFG